MNHYGRTELAKILGLLALATVLLTLPGWAAGTPGDSTVYVPDYYNGLSIALYEGPATEYVTGDEVAALLERCLEYVRDGHRQALGSFTTLAIAQDFSPLGMAKEKARNAQAEVDRIEKETKLRRDIEAVLGKLRKGE